MDDLMRVLFDALLIVFDVIYPVLMSLAADVYWYLLVQSTTIAKNFQKDNEKKMDHTKVFFVVSDFHQNQEQLFGTLDNERQLQLETVYILTSFLIHDLVHTVVTYQLHRCYQAYQVKAWFVPSNLQTNRLHSAIKTE